MTRRTYSILAGVVGSAVGAWWWSRQRGRTALPAASRQRGEVIFDNTPTATPLSTEGLI